MKLRQECSLGLCLAISISFFACHSARRDQISPAKDFTIIFGSGGGFTGMAEGYIIHGDGQIEKWSGFHTQRSKAETIGVVTPEALQSLRQTFETKVFAQWSYRKTGNMTTLVQCIRGNDTTVVSWPGLEPGNDVPPDIQDFYRNLMHAVQTAKKDMEESTHDNKLDAPLRLKLRERAEVRTQEQALIRCLIEFNGPVKDEEKRQLEAAGLRLLTVVNQIATAEGGPDAIHRAAAYEFVRSISLSQTRSPLQKQ